MVGRDCGDWAVRMGRNDSEDGRKVVAALWQQTLSLGWFIENSDGYIRLDFIIVCFSREG
eukprot:scaffold1796_cov107-Skeletonema_dohrnii-CCMP3373.AAC.3